MPKDKESELEQAKALIDQFCQAEYGSHADFNNLEKIDIAYTTLNHDDEEIPLQVRVDLVHYCIEYFLDDKYLKGRQYENLGELIQHELEILDFDELIAVSDEELDDFEYDRYIEETWELTEEAWPIFQKQLDAGNYWVELEDVIESLRRDRRLKEKEEQIQNQDIGKER